MFDTTPDFEMYLCTSRLSVLLPIEEIALFSLGKSVVTALFVCGGSDVLILDRLFEGQLNRMLSTTKGPDSTAKAT